MTTRHQVKWYPLASLGLDGKLIVVQPHSYEVKGSVSAEYGYIHIALEPLELEIELPSEEELRSKALAVLQADRQKLRAEHQALMTKYQYLENQLLGLAAPELVAGERVSYAEARADVSDAQIKQALKGEEDDDIPF